VNHLQVKSTGILLVVLTMLLLRYYAVGMARRLTFGVLELCCTFYLAVCLHFGQVKFSFLYLSSFQRSYIAIVMVMPPLDLVIQKRRKGYLMQYCKDILILRVSPGHQSQMVPRTL